MSFLLLLIDKICILRQTLKSDYAGECLHLTHESKTEEIHTFSSNRKTISLTLLIGGMYWDTHYCNTTFSETLKPDYTEEYLYLIHEREKEEKDTYTANP